MYFQNIYEYSILCQKGDLLEIDTFFKKNRERDMESYFIYTCKNGYLEVAKWILFLKPITYNYIDYNHLFQSVCYNGHIEILKWLLLLNPNIKISANGEMAFYKSCQKGHLHIVEWLLSIRPDIDISFENDRAFKIACQNGHIGIATWFSTLSKKYRVVIRDNVIADYYVRPELPMVKDIFMEKKGDGCPVCYEQNEDLETNCGHQFCETCIEKIYDTTKTCPCCRTSITEFYICKS